MARYLALLGVFIAMLAVFYAGLGRDPRELPSPLLNKAAPEFELSTVTDPGRTVGSKDFAGKMALVNVWATWCVGCRQEHDYLLELAGRNELPIYGINWRDQRDQAREWLQKLGNPYVASAYDEDGRVGIDWGVYGAPETFLVNRDGAVVYKHVGPLHEGVWQQEFRPRIDAERAAQ